MSNYLPYCSSLLVLLCMLSTRILAQKNTTISPKSRPTTPEEHHTGPDEHHTGPDEHYTGPDEHHTYSEETIEHFFEKYGDGNGSIIASQLCNFTQKLSGCSAKASSDGHDHGSETSHERVVDGTNEGEEEHHEEEEHEEDEEEHEEEGEHDEEKCPGVYKLLKEKNYTETSKISENHFSELCPALYAILVSQIKEQEEEKPHEGETKLSQGHVWGFATVAITIISLSSLLVIAVIPLLGKSYYNKIMSFLVALAIGSLAGDALLHLIPHSLVPHSEHNHDEEAAENDKKAIFRSFIIFVGIYVFFLVECCMKLKLARRKKVDTRILYGAGKQQMQQLAGGPDTARLSVAVEAVKEDPENAEPSRQSVNAFIMEVTSGNRRSSRQVRDSLWMAYMATMDENGEIPFNDENLSSPGAPKEHHRSNRESYSGRKIDTLREENSREDLLAEIPETNNIEKKRESSEGSTNSKADSEAQENVGNHNNNHNHADSGPGHSHSHQKDIDGNTKIASLAWMVIVGDGFHNLADGLAVGAAFSASFTSGLSTAIAVFCHELPHELGDFAVLVKAGMTVKQAITYNMVSAVIAFMGMIVGILIGSNESSIVYVLALTAGMFLYISLVDMLPELCTQLAEEDFKTGLWTFFYQNLGILTGVLIMYLISLME